MFATADEAHINRERNKAKRAKKLRWWQQKTASGRCHYCQKVFPPKKLTMDHIVPVSRGGMTSPGNVVPSCLSCNKKKSMDTPIETLLDSFEN